MNSEIVKHLGFTMNGRLLATIVSATAFAGCGLELSLPPELPLPVVQLATRAELIAEDVVPGSYIVAFRGQSLAHRLLNLPEYREEWAFHNQYLTADYTYDPRVKDVRYIHAIDGARRYQDPAPLGFLLTPWKQDLVDEDAPAEPVLRGGSRDSPEESCHRGRRAGR